MLEQSQNQNAELKTRKIFESEFARYMGIVILVFPMILFVYQVKTDIALIQQDINNINMNHEAHIQDILQEIKEMKQIAIQQSNQIIDLQKQVIVLQRN